MDMDMKVQYLCIFVYVEALRQVDLVSDDVENTNTSLTVDNLLKIFFGVSPCEFTY